MVGMSMSVWIPLVVGIILISGIVVSIIIKEHDKRYIFENGSSPHSTIVDNEMRKWLSENGEDDKLYVLIGDYYSYTVWRRNINCRKKPFWDPRWDTIMEPDEHFDSIAHRFDDHMFEIKVYAR